MVILLLLVKQPWNAAQAAAQGFGIHVDLPMPTQPAAIVKKLRQALQQMLNDPSDTTKVQHISRLLQAQLWTPVEQAASGVVSALLTPWGCCLLLLLYYVRFIVICHGSACIW